MVRSSSSYLLFGMILLSLALGLFISYFFVFVNALFISEIGTSKLPFAYLLSGFAGLFISWVFNSLEKKLGFAKTSTLLGFIFSAVIFLIWFFYTKGKGVYYIIFFAYAWFWISTNFTALVFWKLPSNLFNLEENKKYNSIISSGEGISAIIAYLSVPALLTLDFFTRDKLVLISFVGMALFSVITFVLGSKIKNPNSPQAKKTEDPKKNQLNQILREPYFQLIFYSVVLSIVVQFLIDFSLMEVSANQMRDPKQLAQYFSFIFGGMRVIELTLKFFISKYLVREHGVFISLTSLIFALLFVTLVGLTSFFTGYLSLILIVASLGKVFERSFYRSIYAPTINLLYQAYPQDKRSLTQNYADGYGKTIGQLIAAAFIFGFAQILNFEDRILILLLVVLVILFIWFFVSKKLINHYKLELTKILNTLKSKTEKITSELGLDALKNTEKEPITTKSNSDLEFADYLKKMLHAEEGYEQKTGKMHPDISDEKESEVDQLTADFIKKIKNYNTYHLTKSSYLVSELIRKGESRSLELIYLLINIQLILTNDGFSFHHSQNSLKKSNFLYSGVIQNYSKKQKSSLELQDYYFLLEERMLKFTYLLNSLKEVQYHSKTLELLLKQEISSTKLEILFCLSLRHDASTLDQIVTMINKGTKSEELLALELLELMLDDQEKKWVLAIFKESNFDRILSRLEQDFPQIALGLEDRLISIVTTKKIDLPDLIKREALQTLLSNNQNSKNKVLIQVLNEHTFKIEENNQLNKQEGTDKVKTHDLQAELIAQLKVNPQFSLSFFYWKNLLQIKESTEETSNLNRAIKQLYQAVFPLEKLNG